MEIPYNEELRPDTGLYNAKLGIWLFLASEVMLFGGLFSAYIFLRLAAPPGDFEYWASKLSVPMATVNTMVLISSSVSMVMAWASLKLKDFPEFKKMKKSPKDIDQIINTLIEYITKKQLNKKTSILQDTVNYLVNK